MREILVPASARARVELDSRPCVRLARSARRDNQHTERKHGERQKTSWREGGREGERNEERKEAADRRRPALGRKRAAAERVRERAAAKQ